MDSRALVTFVAAERRLALPLVDVQCVVPLPLLQSAVESPSFLEGFFDHGGSPVAAVRVDRLLNLGDDHWLGVYSPLLVMRSCNPAIALHVARVTSVIKPGVGDIQPIGRNETFNACVVGRVSDGAETIYVLASEQILLAEERAKIVALQAIRRRRVQALAHEATGAAAHAS